MRSQYIDKPIYLLEEVVAFEVTMQSIQPLLKPLIVQGRLIYDYRSGAFALIRLKKKLLEEFSGLKEDRHWRYQMEYWSSYDLTIDRIIEAYRKHENPPILLFIYPEQ